MATGPATTTRKAAQAATAAGRRTGTERTVTPSDTDVDLALTLGRALADRNRRDVVGSTQGDTGADPVTTTSDVSSDHHNNCTMSTHL